MLRSASVEIDPFHLHATFDMQVLGKFDPTVRREPASITKAHHDTSGRVVVWRFTADGTSLRIEFEGDDASLFDVVLQQFPVRDGATSFAPGHPLLRKLTNGLRGMRLLRMPWTWDITAGSVLQQRVTWQRAYGDFRKIALRFGTRAAGGAVFPSAAQLAAVPLYRLESIGLDPKRARALHLVACADVRHSFLHPHADAANVKKRLLAIRGIGPWTVSRTMGLAYGDTDAMVVGDLHLPSLVTQALAGEEEGNDERMAQLLEPYVGQRFRVQRLLQWAARRAPHVL